MALQRELKALLPILEDPENAECDSALLAELLIDALDRHRLQHPRMAVVLRHHWGTEGTEALAVLGPFGTRADLTARRMGENACASLAHPGSGRYVMAPMYASPQAAWAAIKPPESTQLLREQVAADVAAWIPESIWADGVPHPSCRCGLVGAKPCRVHPKAAA